MIINCNFLDFYGNLDFYGKNVYNSKLPFIFYIMMSRKLTLNDSFLIPFTPAISEMAKDLIWIVVSLKIPSRMSMSMFHYYYDYNIDTKFSQVMIYMNMYTYISLT